MTNASSSGSVARWLLPHVRDPQVAGRLLVTADLYSELTLEAAPSPDTLADAKSWSVAKTVTAARATDDPLVLDKLARNSRLAVRRAVAANPHLATATIAYLQEWAHRKDDCATLEGIIDRVDLATELALLETSETHEWGYPLDQLIARLVEHAATAEGTELVVKFFATERSKLLVALAHAVGNGDLPTITPTDAIRAGRSEACRVLIAISICSTLRHLDVATARTLVETVKTELSRNGRALVLTGDGHLQSCEPEAARIMLKEATKQLVEWTTLAALDAASIDLLIESGHLNAIKLFARSHPERFDADQLRRLFIRLTDPQEGGPFSRRHLLYSVISDVLGPAPPDLDSTTLLTLLRWGSLACTREWLAGETRRPPQPGEVAALIADPCGAFDQTLPREPCDPPDLPAIMSRLDAKVWSSVFAKPWADELVDAVGMHFFTGPESAGRLLSERFATAFGSDAERWMLATTLLPEWEDSVGALIEAVLLTTADPEPSGPACETPDSDPAPAPIADATTGQLALV